MTIKINSAEDIEHMRESCRLASQVLDHIAPHIRPGITTLEIDRLGLECMNQQGTKSATIGYQPPGMVPYPGHLCTSVNHVVCHGIPNDKPLKKGDVMNIDITVIKDGWHGDTSRMFVVGEGSIAAKRLCALTYDAKLAAPTLTATLTGYTFTPEFTNPLTLTAAGATAQNWTAVSVPEVTLSASNAAEGGENGAFVITRTGDVSAALAVTVAPASGSATRTTDYSLTPDYTASGSMATLTIPAGQSALTVVVAAVNDTAQEGPETVQLQLAAGAYQVRSGVWPLWLLRTTTPQGPWLGLPPRISTPPKMRVTRGV